MLSCISPRFRLIVQACLPIVFFAFFAQLQAQTTPPRFLTTAEEVLQAYLDANGGKELVDNIRSVRLTGKITEDGATYDIVLVKKRPNLRKLIMLYQGSRITLGYDGQTAWREVVGRGGRLFAILEGDEKRAFVEDSSFDGPLVDWQQKGNSVKLLRTEEMGRTDAYVIEITEPSGKQSEVWIEAQTMQEIKTRTFRANSEGGVTKIETLMSDYRKFDGIWMALTVERFVDDKSVSLMKIADLNINFGVFNDYFAPPPESTTE